MEAADPEDDAVQTAIQTFCLDEKALPAAEQFLLARYTLHEQVYFHKTTRSVEYLIAQLLGRVADVARSTEGSPSEVALSSDHPIWRFFATATQAIEDYLALDDGIVTAAFEAMTRAQDSLVADLAGRLRARKLYKTLDIRRFGHEDGQKKRAERQIDEMIKNGDFAGKVHKDQSAKVGIYTQIGGDDERMHKKLHIVDSRGPREITGFSTLIEELAEPKQFTRYYFENESDRQMAKRLRKA